MKKDSAFELFENFKFGDKKYILFGKNGAGKTKLLKYLSTLMFNTNSFVIPADRSTVVKDDYYTMMSSKTFNDQLKMEGAIKTLLIMMDGYQDKKLCDDTISIFNNLGLERKLKRNEKQQIFLYESNVPDYNLEQGSDGEKSIVYLLLAVIQMPQNAFCFIDEPENHLNGALLRKLFNELEKARPDIKFIYATHNINFIESRQNTELIYLEKTDSLENWEFKKFDKYDELPLDVILNMEGTNDNVIFCEGEDLSSIDFKLYEILYPKYEIQAANGHENVERQTEMLNKYKSTFKKKGLGIIDNDFKDENSIVKQNQKKITVLKVNEVENLLITHDCLLAMIDFIEHNKPIDEIKAKIISIISSKKDEIKKDYATKLLRRIHLKNKLANAADIENELDKINEENKTKFIDKFNQFETMLTKAIDEKNYDDLQKLVPGKMILTNIAIIYGFHDADMYKEKILLQISRKQELQDKLRDEIGLVI